MFPLDPSHVAGFHWNQCNFRPSSVWIESPVIKLSSGISRLKVLARKQICVFPRLCPNLPRGVFLFFFLVCMLLLGSSLLPGLILMISSCQLWSSMFLPFTSCFTRRWQLLPSLSVSSSSFNVWTANDVYFPLLSFLYKRRWIHQKPGLWRRLPSQNRRRLSQKTRRRPLNHPSSPSSSPK